MKKLITTFIISTGLISSIYAQSIIYVDSAALGANDGTSWTDAYNHLQDALGVSEAGDSIWIAKGTYYPDEGVGFVDDARDNTFNLVDSVAIYGGFSGEEISLNERDWVANPVILSGEIQEDDDSFNNAYTVVTSESLSGQTLLDGLTIAYGRHDSNSGSDVSGGLICYFSDTRFSNLIIRDNNSFSDDYGKIGGGVYVSESEPIFTNIIVSDNTAGGSSYCGGGMAFNGSKPILTNVTVRNNNAYTDSDFTAGGILFLSVDAGTSLTNVIINNNIGVCFDGPSAGGIMNSAGFLICSNITISNNEGTSIVPYNTTGGIYNYYTASVEINNSIIWNNQGESEDFSEPTHDILNIFSEPIVKNSLLSAYDEGIDCIVGVDPLFVNQGFIHIIDYSSDLHLQLNSPARNMGSVLLLPSDTADLNLNYDFEEQLPLDADLNPRVNACQVDLGAYEYQSVWENEIADSSVCFTGDPISFIGDGESLFWFADPELTIELGTGDIFDTEEVDPGTFTYYLTDSTLNCPRQITDTVSLNINALPELDLGVDTAFCSGDSVLIDGGSFEDYLWSTSETSANIYVNSVGLFHVLVTDLNGCQNSDTIEITENPLPLPDLGSDTSFCADDEIELIGGLFDEYLWNTLATSANIIVNTGGTYDVTVTDINGCQNSDTIEVTENPLPMPDLGIDTIICEGDILVLDPGSFDSFLWHDSSTEANWTVDTELLELGTYIYHVTVMDENDCSNSDSITVEITECLSITENGFNSSTVIYPNPFSNNLTVESNEEILTIIIYDMNGKRVFYQDDIHQLKYSISPNLSPGLYFLEVNGNEQYKIAKP